MDFYILDWKLPKELVAYVESHKEVKITVTADSKRTISQNSLYWANVDVLTESGYTKDEIHERVKLSIGLRKWLIKKIWGKEINSFTTKNLSTTEFNEVMEFIYNIWNELWYYMKFPSDLWLQNMPELDKNKAKNIQSVQNKINTHEIN